MKLPLRIDNLSRKIEKINAFGKPYVWDQLPLVDVVPDDHATGEEECAFISDADGKALAWYSGCGTHMLTITQGFFEFLQQLK